VDATMPFIPALDGAFRPILGKTVKRQTLSRVTMAMPITFQE